MKLLGTLLLLLTMCAPLAATQKIGDIVFQTNFDSLMQTSHDQNQTILIKFYTEW
ncbi:MAG: hypothetical protein IPH59_15040 [bacterium]|nr:hypothetical protein [bacterium]